MRRTLCYCLLLSTLLAGLIKAQSTKDVICQLQTEAIDKGRAPWGHWGTDPSTYYNWCQHSNRLVPVYTFGIKLDSVANSNSVYRDKDAIAQLFGRLPEATFNPRAEYFDQTDIYRLQTAALLAGKKNIILLIFDGMDWQTTRAAAIFRSGSVGYQEGRGTGLRFQDYRSAPTDFGYCVTAPHSEGTEYDVNTQRVTKQGDAGFGGYDPLLAGQNPWESPRDPSYLLGWNADRYHVVTDSANAATAMATGKKTFNGSINVSSDGQRLETIAHLCQSRGFSIGLVTNVPISHATPAAAYAHNVERMDYQDIARDLLGLKSVSHPSAPLQGVDVLLGCGWNEVVDSDPSQGQNFVAGNQYVTLADLEAARSKSSHSYHVVERTVGKSGKEILQRAAQEAIRRQLRLLGIFGVKSGHLPYQTANRDFRPTKGVTEAGAYTQSDLQENPSLSDMTTSALQVLSQNPKGFWLMVEAGDVDWASHDVNIDNTIGAILSGDEAFGAITDWVEARHAWNDTVVIVTSDHGHGFVLAEPTAFANSR